MSKRKTSSEVQEYIRQRYEDTALAIYHEQHFSKKKKISENKTEARTVQHALEDIAEVREDDLRTIVHPAGSRALNPGAPKNDVQSQICVII